MTNDPFHSKFAEHVLSEIKSGKVKMRPKVHFLLKSVLVVLCSIVISLFVLYIISLIAFGMRLNGSWFAPEFGLRGLGIFLSAVPIYLFLISIALIIVLEILVRKFSFSHRMPILYTLLGVTIFVFIGGIIVDKSGLHARILRTSQNGFSPEIVHMYKSCCGPRPENAYRGVIRGFEKSEITLENSQGEFFEIVISEKTRLPMGGNFDIGDEIMVIGDKDGETIQAFGIRKVGDDFGGPPIQFPQEKIDIIQEQIQ